MKIFLVLVIFGFVGPLMPEILRGFMASIKAGRTRPGSDLPRPSRLDLPHALPSPAVATVPSWRPGGDPSQGALRYKQWLTAPAGMTKEGD